jgi:DNA-binding helix-turn-helix protein
MKGSDNMEINTKKLQIAMARKCMNPSDLAAAIGCTSTSVQQILRGARGVQTKKLGLISKALEIDPAELID